MRKIGVFVVVIAVFSLIHMSQLFAQQRMQWRGGGGWFVDETIAADDVPVMDYQAIIAKTVGKDNTFGAVVGRVRAEPFTYCRDIYS